MTSPARAGRPRVELARAERAALCDLLEAVGPDAPTLCEGWRTRDLAAHLVLREGRLDALPGITVPFLSGWTSRVQEKLAAGDFHELVGRLRFGPPRFSPFRPARVNEAANGIEFFVHHEDVRRAQPTWAPRELDAATAELVWRRAKATARFFQHRKRIGVELVRADSGERHLARRAAPGRPTLSASGEPAELLMFLFGRRDHAIVELTPAQFD